jgi:hypothetical protein
LERDERDPTSGATRIRVFDMLAAQRIPLIAYHFPWPGIGHVAKRARATRMSPRRK